MITLIVVIVLFILAILMGTALAGVAVLAYYAFLLWIAYLFIDCIIIAIKSFVEVVKENEDNKKENNK